MLKKVASFIKHHKKFIITSHVAPDGDGIGSELALQALLKKMGKEALILNEAKVPKTYHFLPEVEKILSLPEAEKIKSSGWEKRYDAGVVLDCSNSDRIGGILKFIKGKPILNIDHHLDNQNFGEVNWVDTKVSACGEQIYCLICHLIGSPRPYHGLGSPIPKDVATFLYTAILTETCGFRYNIRLGTHKILSSFVAQGADPEKIARSIYQNVSFSAFKLLGLAIQTVKQTKRNNCRICWMKVTKSMYRKSKSSEEDTESFVDYLRTIQGAEIVFILKEMDAKKTKVSLRSIGNIDVQKVAKKFDGGGHKNAAGCTIKDSIENAERKILKALNF